MMTPIEPTTPIAVTLQAQEWNQVIYWLGKQPYEAVAALIGKIGDQAQAAAGQTLQPPLTNGADSHVRD
jgi:hypothetical protein